METLDKILDSYKQKVGLPAAAVHDFNTAKYFNMSRDELHRLSIEDCAEAVFLLNSLAYHVQMEYNQQLSTHNWATRAAKKQVVNKLNNYYGRWDQQELAAIKDDSHASDLDKVARESQIRMDSINFAASAIRFLSDTLINLQKAKLGKNRYE